MPNENAQLIGEFLDYFWEQERGLVAIATRKANGPFEKGLVKWPEKRKDVIQYLSAKAAQGEDVFFGPAIFAEDAPRGESQYVKSLNVRWVEIDEMSPDDWPTTAKEKGIPEPTLQVQSSVAGRQHAYWLTPRTEDIDTVQDQNRALSATLGADMSGWDANQLLRVPGTFNFGYKSNGERKPWWDGEPQPVVVVGGRRNETVDPTEFSALQQAERVILDDLAIATVPDVREVLALGTWSKDLWEQFNLTEQEAIERSPEKRSGSLMRLAYLAAEAGLTNEQMYAIILDTGTRWRKYDNRSNAGKDKLVRDLIARARAKVGYTKLGDLTFAGLTGQAKQDFVSDAKIAYNYAEFMDADFHIDWALEGLLPIGGFGIIVGQPGAGKSTLAMQIAHEVAAGWEHTVRWNIVGGAKKVLYLSLEMGGPTLKLMVGDMSPRYKKDAINLTKNLTIVPLGSTLYLDRPEGQAFLDNLVAEYRPDVLVIDSLQKSVSKPMSDEGAIKALVDHMLVNVRNKYSTGVIFIHHERKRSQNNKGGEGLSEVYGNQMLNAEIDFAIALRKHGKYVAMDDYKNRLAEEQTDIMFERGEHRELVRVANANEDTEDYSRTSGFIDNARGAFRQYDPDEQRRGRENFPGL